MIRPPLISTDMCAPFPSISPVWCIRPRAERRQTGTGGRRSCQSVTCWKAWAARSTVVLLETSARQREPHREAVHEAAGDARRGKTETRPGRVEGNQREPVGHAGAGELDVVLADPRGRDRHRRRGEEVVAGEELLRPGEEPSRAPAAR